MFVKLKNKKDTIIQIQITPGRFTKATISTYFHVYFKGDKTVLSILPKDVIIFDKFEVSGHKHRLSFFYPFA